MHKFLSFSRSEPHQLPRFLTTMSSVKVYKAPHLETKLDLLTVESGVPVYQTEKQPIVFEMNLELSTEDVPKIPGAYLLHNTLSQFECNQFVNLTEFIGYETATITSSAGVIKDESYRNNKRVILQNKEIVADLWKRVQKFVPPTIQINNGNWRNMNFEACGLNERLRFYRYEKGEVFLPHYDGCYPRPDGSEVSFYTFIVYLSDGFKGGCTTFFENGDERKRHPVQPVLGSALIFPHGSHKDSPLHEGGLRTNNSDSDYDEK